MNQICHSKNQAMKSYIYKFLELLWFFIVAVPLCISLLIFIEVIDGTKKLWGKIKYAMDVVKPALFGKTMIGKDSVGSVG
jgi:hypothetical protein